MPRIKRHRKKKTPKVEIPAVITTASVVEALYQAGGVQSHAAKLLGMSKEAIWNRVNRSPRLQEAVREAKEITLDLAETELMKKIKAGHIAAIIFYLKCQGKDRGYIEKQELDVNANIKGGVLVVPAIPATAEEWLEKFPPPKPKQLTGGNKR